MSKILDAIKSVFTPELRAKVWKILFRGAVTGIVTLLQNEDLMNAAFEISLSLLGVRVGGNAKTAEFNMRMRDWCKANGMVEVSSCDMNAIREVAYAAVRAHVEAT